MMTKINLTLFRDMPEEGFLSMERYARELLRGLRAGREDLTVREFSIHRTNFIRPLRPLLRFIPVIKNYANDRYFSRYFLYPQKVRSVEGEINHVIDHSYGHLLFRLHPERTVVTCHDLIPLDYEDDPTALSVFRYSVSGLKLAARIIAVSEATKNDLISKLNITPSKIRVVAEGVDGRQFQVQSSRFKVEEIRRQYHLPPGKILLHVGTNLRYKNMENILKAFQIVLKSGADVHLLKIGLLSAAQKDLARSLGIESRVLERSAAAEGDLPFLYNLAAVLVYPSLKEGFGFPVLEALACGLPVIVSRGTSLTEIAGPSGFNVNPNDPVSIAGAVNFALNLSYDQKQKVIESGLDRAKEFTWDKTAAETAKIYHEVYESLGGRK